MYVFVFLKRSHHALRRSHQGIASLLGRIRSTTLAGFFANGDIIFTQSGSQCMVLVRVYLLSSLSLLCSGWRALASAALSSAKRSKIESTRSTRLARKQTTTPRDVRTLVMTNNTGLRAGRKSPTQTVRHRCHSPRNSRYKKRAITSRRKRA